MSDKLWFSVASKLNDPFETMAGIGHPRFDNILGDFSRNQIIEHNYRIFCLTRDPLSSIMWSHYADQHHGIVIGIDSAAAGLEDEATCILPAQYGSMIYTRTKPNFAYGEKADLPPGFAPADNYDHRSLQFLQRNFLYKSSEWHYEEEVRVLKTTHSLTNNILLPMHEDGYPPVTGAAFNIPNEAIREIYLGPRFYLDDCDKMADIFKFIISAAPHAVIFDAYRDRQSWRMTAAKIEDWHEHLREIYYPR